MKRLVVLAVPLLLAACADQRAAAPAPGARAPATSAYVVPQPSAEVRDAQQRLRTLGLYDGPIDGIWGPATETAIMRFQQHNGFEATGRLDNRTLAEIRRDAAPPRTAAAPAVDPDEPLQPQVIRGVQQRLNRLGFYPGQPDGIWGPATERGLERFQRSRGLEVTGVLTPATAQELGLDPNNLSASTSQRSLRSARR